tara:strand:+ start:13786 stop:14142 length:357 start_codon:yes stop_codon:yes gene_type:complete
MAITTNQLTLTQKDVLTVPASLTYAVTNVLVCNTYSPSGGSASTRNANFTMHIIPSGSALNNNITCVVKELNLPAGETFTFDSERIVLSAGDKITFTASPDQGSGNTDLACVVSYMEV